MDKIVFLAQFPPPVHGLSVAVKTLYESNINEKFSFDKINLTNNRAFIKNILCMIKLKRKNFYFTISQTKGGNLRDLIILKILELKGAHCLVHLHGGYYRTLVDHDLPAWQKKWNYSAMKKIDGAIVLSDSLRWIFSGMLPENQIYVVPNCVDNSCLCSSENFERKLDMIQNNKIHHVLYLSNFIRSKGYDVVLELAKKEKEHTKETGIRRYHFDFAGKFFEAEEEMYFNQFVRQNELEEYITYHGIVGGHKKADLLKLCEVFILITRYPNEGQPISIIEAMANGMFIVTTDHAGIPTLVKNGKNGLLLSKENDHDILYIYEHMEPSVQIAMKNRQDVEIQYLQEHYIQNMANVFKKVYQ